MSADMTSVKMGYPAWLCQQLAIENDPVEIVDFPINSMVIFNSYVKLPEGICSFMTCMRWRMRYPAAEPNQINPAAESNKILMPQICD